MASGLHATAPPSALFVFPALRERPDLLVDEVPHRAIGVVCRPEQEQLGNYVPTRLGTGTTRSCGSTRPGGGGRCTRCTSTRTSGTYPSAFSTSLL